MNNKILSVVLVAGVAATGFAGLSSASETGTGFFKGNSEIRELKEKVESGVELTATEQATLDELKSHKGDKSAHGGKRKGRGKLSDEEKAELENLSDEEKKAFFEAKKTEMNAAKEAKAALVAKLIAGESLSNEQETLRAEMVEKLSENSDKVSKKPGFEVIKKLINGESITAEDQVILDEMQAKKAEKEAQKAILEPIKAKLEAGEELTADEQATLDELKANKGDKKGSKKGHGGKRKGGGKLSDEEKAELENLSDEEKKAFFKAKKADREQK